MVLNTEWVLLEAIDLYNDGSGLGFGIIGGRSTGVVVKTILDGGIADNDNRLKSGDHLLRIGGINLRGMGSDQVASVLRQSNAHIRLFVARCVQDPHNVLVPEGAALVPHNQLECHVNNLGAALHAMDNNQPEAVSLLLQAQEEAVAAARHFMRPQNNCTESFIEQNSQQFEVELAKGSSGLGITIAGFVEEQPEDGRENKLQRIFVKSITKGSAADEDNRIQINDQIVQVGGKALKGFTDEQAMEILKNTGPTVKLSLIRHFAGPEYEQFTNLSNLSDVGVQSSPLAQLRDYSLPLTDEQEALIQRTWKEKIGQETTIVVVRVGKFHTGGGLGMSLEGTVDVVNNIEVCPHHYIRSVLPDGPVGMHGGLRNGDELLQVNDFPLFGIDHTQVVSILKNLPQHVQIVCSRFPGEQRDLSNKDAVPSTEEGTAAFNVTKSELIKAKSEQQLPILKNLQSLSKVKCHSVELLSGLTTWSSEVTLIDLSKDNRGLGFCILDYKNPLNTQDDVILIQSLVPGGVAQADGRLTPGDRLIAVNDCQLEGATLDQAIRALKRAPKGIVSLSVTKPLCFPEKNFDKKTETACSLLNTQNSFHLQRNSPASSTTSTAPSTNTSTAPSTTSTAPSTTSTAPNTTLPAQSTTLNTLSTILSAPSTILSAPSTTLPAPSTTSPAASTTLPAPSTTLPAASATSQSSPQKTLQHSFIQQHMSYQAYRADQVLPHLAHSTFSSINSPDVFPEHLAQPITIGRTCSELGLEIEATDQPCYGCVITKLEENGCIAEDGRLSVGDYIVSINSESMESVSTVQAKSILKRASLGSEKIVINFLSAGDVDAYFNKIKNSSQAQQPKSLLSAKPRVCLSPTATVSSIQDEDGKQDSTDISMVWNPSHEVTLSRKNGESLGISIVAARLDFFNAPSSACQEKFSGIFVKQVLENSPAKLNINGELRIGDRILKVGETDLRSATHEEAVQALRCSGNVVNLTVQSLNEPLGNNIKLSQFGSAQRSATAETLETELHLNNMSPVWQVPCEFQERLQAQYGDLPGELLVVELDRRSNSLGIILAGHKDRAQLSSFVVGIIPESPTAKDGSIQIGDQLLEINRHILHGRNHLNASTVIKNVHESHVVIVILREENSFSKMAVAPMSLQSALPLTQNQQTFTAPQFDECKSNNDEISSSVCELQILPTAGFSLFDDSCFPAACQVLLSEGLQRLHLTVKERLCCGESRFFIDSVKVTSPDEEAGQLLAGDELLAVGNNYLRRASYDKVNSLLRASTSPVFVSILPAEDNSSLEQSNSPPSSNLHLNMTDESNLQKLANNEEGNKVDLTICSIPTGRDVTIEIRKGQLGLGMSIMGGSDTILNSIVVHEIYKNGAIAKDGRLRRKDRLLEANGMVLQNVAHDIALQALRQASPLIRLLVHRDEHATFDEALYKEFTVDLLKKPGRGLGLSIVGRHNEPGVFISEVFTGSTAEADGQLARGDQIMMANGQNLSNSTQERAATILKTLMGKVTLKISRLKGQKMIGSLKSRVEQTAECSADM